MEETEKKNYEISCLLAKEEDADVVLRLLRQHGIEAISDPRVKKIKLSYPIKKTTQADFWFIRCSASPEAVVALEKDLKTAAGILRFIIVKLPKEALGVQGETGGRPPRKFVPRKTTLPQKRTEVLSNEALEKKIEEILQ